MNNRLFIFDTTLRDGEQVPGCQLNTVEKIQVAKQLEALGVDIIEAGFPISSPGDFNSVVEISKAVTWPTICALTRAVEKDIDVAAESLKYAKHKRIHTGIGTSDSHIKYKFNSNREEIIERAVAAVKYAKRYVDTIPDFCSFINKKPVRGFLHFLRVCPDHLRCPGAQGPDLLHDGAADDHPVRNPSHLLRLLRRRDPEAYGAGDLRVCLPYQRHHGAEIRGDILADACNAQG